MATFALVDDHILMRKGLANLLRDLDHEVLLEADNGLEFMKGLKTKPLPDIVLLDINMPQMDGYETALHLRQKHPDVRVIALSMYDDEVAIIRMLRNGVRGYILKDCEPGELKAAIHAVITKGFYYSELVTGPLIRSIRDSDNSGKLDKMHRLNDNETELLKYCCTELTYKEIADKMCLSPRTIDGYRDELFKKLGVKSRIGLVMYAIRSGFVKP